MQSRNEIVASVGIVALVALVGVAVLLSPPSVPAERWVAVATLALVGATSLSILFAQWNEGAKYRVNLVLDVRDNGSVLAVANLGPGVAKDVGVTFFGYPATPEAGKPLRDMGVPETYVGGGERSYVYPGEAYTWFVHSEPRPGGMDVPSIIRNLPAADYDWIVEISGTELFDRPAGTRRYWLSRRSAPISWGGVQVIWWTWRIVQEVPGQPRRYTSIQQALDESRSQGPPR